MWGTFQIDFDSPAWLLLGLLAPALWWFSYRSLAGLGTWRRAAALTLRTAVLALLVAALAEVRWVRSSHRLTVIYLLDQSLSIPAPRREAMRQYVNQAVERHRVHDDRAGVIVFGRDAAIEIPPVDESIPLGATVESLFDPEHTNLAAAMRLAQATFPEDAAQRIVIVSDGNENLGSAVEQAQALAEAGVSIDTVPVFFQARAEVSVDRLSVPADVRKGTPFDLRVVVNNAARADAPQGGVVAGKLVISQTIDNQPVVLSEQAVQLTPGKHAFSLRQQIEQAAPYTYEARFIPDDPADDALVQNNRATAFTYVRGSGQVLMLEDPEHRGEFDHLAARLRAQNLEVSLRPSDQSFSSLPELQQFDTVLLANVPREDFSEQQIKMLARNTEQMGCGLVMLGGPNSFGAGGWSNTEVERAMPVDFQIKSAKVSPRGALALLMHASEMAQGNYWQKVIAQEAIKALGAEDYCGVLHWDGAEQWLWNPPQGLTKVGGNRDRMLAKLDRMTPGDMPDFDPTLIMARQSFAKLNDVAVKHMVVISDGDPTSPSSSVIQSLVTGKITVSTVAVGTHGPAGSAELKKLATRTGGKYYEVRNPKALPRIFQREARRVASPLIYDQPPPFSPQLVTDHEMIRGLPAVLPPITGYVMTTVKQNPLVEVVLRSPRPGAAEHSTVLAGWNFGLGRAVAFTSDGGARWASDWLSWEGYDKLFGQMVRWSMRPVGDQGKFTLSTEVRDGQGQIVITSLDNDDAYLNFLPMSGSVLGPDMEPRELKLEQVAPGRYVGRFEADDAGSYFVLVNPGPRMSPLRTGVNVPYSAEFRARETDEALLTTLAHFAPRGGQPGRLIVAPAGAPAPLESLLQVDSFRHDLPPATSSLEAWHLATLLASCLFFFDVLVRRVAFSLAWVPRLAQQVRLRWRGHESTAADKEYLDRLRNRKAEVGDQLDLQRAATRFEPTPAGTTAAQNAVAEALRDAPPVAPPTAPGSTSLAPEVPAESYTSRLLKAKQEVWKDRKQP